MKKYLYSSDILLPDISEKKSGESWAVIACDQFTSEPEYWHEAEKIAFGKPSALNIMLPEAFLDESAERIPKINQTMQEYLSSGILSSVGKTAIYVERTQSDEKIRRGIVGAIDMEDYSYEKSSKTLTRATEGTVLDRIPPRVKIRRGASLEMPHIMILIDDTDHRVIKPIAQKADQLEKIYDFPLMLGGGYIKGYKIDDAEMDRVNCELSQLASAENTVKKYGKGAEPLLFAVGDGNHSLAAAKATYEALKKEIGEEAASTHPCRYALAEIVNLHDEALEFEPIYRVIFNVDPNKFICEFKNYASKLNGELPMQKATAVFGENSEQIIFENPTQQLTVGTVQMFIDQYISEHPDATVDYIHGEDSARALAKAENSVALIFDGMKKSELFKTVIFDGALPRKTFSMGLARDKRYYLECRKIVL